MRKILIVLLGLFLLAGCAQQSGDNKETGAVDQLLYSEQDDGAAYEIRYKKDWQTASNGGGEIHPDRHPDRKKGGAGCEQGRNLTLQQRVPVGIMAGRKTEAFPNSYWDRYTISLGQDNLYLDNAMSTPSEEGDEYRFLLVGGISRSDLQKLKEATLITVQLISSTNPERTTKMPVVPNFQKALLAKMP